MNKLWFLLLLGLNGIGYASLTFMPTINGETSIWLEREGDIAIADSPFVFGMTTPTAETSSFYLFFEYNRNDIIFDMSQMSHNVIDFKYDGVPTGMVILGSFVGPGVIFDNIRIEGAGQLGVYSGDWYPSNADYWGTISIVPEPMSILLLSTGFLWIRKGSKEGFKC